MLPLFFFCFGVFCLYHCLFKPPFLVHSLFLSVYVSFFCHFFVAFSNWNSWNCFYWYATTLQCQHSFVVVMTSKCIQVTSNWIWMQKGNDQGRIWAGTRKQNSTTSLILIRVSIFLQQMNMSLFSIILL